LASSDATGSGVARSDSISGFYDRNAFCGGRFAASNAISGFCDRNAFHGLGMIGDSDLGRESFGGCPL
jgi:hypothetical protein